MRLLNGQPSEHIDSRDRGLQYGDGLFETIAVRAGKMPFLEAHLQRLQKGLTALKINFNESDMALLRQEIDLVTQSGEASDLIVKVMISRGITERGYGYPEDLSANRIISSSAMPEWPERSTNGITVRFCHHALSENPVLAGLKHLNRLDQVLARSEWRDIAIAEGLMHDQSGFLIEGTMSNLFVIQDGIIATPDVSHCGVAGVMRAHLMQLATQLGWTVQVKPITPDELLHADECFVCNSIIGIWPIHHVSETDTYWQVGPMTKQLQTLLGQTIIAS
ncbi:Aminodeoxychorismate lyase [Methylophaga frappieri]|uniref:Aminodeoxychorismate lyase n=1 Tax=Methylophaga frappieri (strain ATCC BAA-2434 / DSM 25690 / JAM7) TaxID=754477 RepID=I1YLL2_METFJ|nr:aminodeoxychorismate lyase [Methylophaga frappieri]AFJ03805.1 Aminodeoxychorismate lyase [Methylophaga frappieri]